MTTTNGVARSTQSATRFPTYSDLRRAMMKPMRPLLGLCVAVALASGCSANEAPAVAVPRTVTVVADTAGSTTTVHILETPEQVEDLVQQFGDCVVERSPGGVAFAIWFDRSTGLVGNTRQMARTDELLRQLDEAIYHCDAELTYRPSINAYIEANPLDGEIEANGLPPDEIGEPLGFGDPALLAPLLRQN